MTTITTILFDLDGTLLDTAPDMAFALNKLRAANHLPDLPLSIIRPHVGYGSKALLNVGFDVNENDPRYPSLLEAFFNLYQTHLADSTQLFAGMENVLNHLDNLSMPWGIVTNKPERFTLDILKKLNLLERTACVICGDSLAKRKPDPDPILHACELIQQEPMKCLYVGDTEIDVIASKAAGTQSLVALYGYIGTEEDPAKWQADGYVHSPHEIIHYLQQQIETA